MLVGRQPKTVLELQFSALMEESKGMCIIPFSLQIFRNCRLALEVLVRCWGLVFLKLKWLTVLEGFGGFSKWGEYKRRLPMSLDISNKVFFVCLFCVCVFWRYGVILHFCFSEVERKSVNTMERETLNHCIALSCVRQGMNCNKSLDAPSLTVFVQ